MATSKLAAILERVRAKEAAEKKTVVGSCAEATDKLVISVAPTPVDLTASKLASMLDRVRAKEATEKRSAGCIDGTMEKQTPEEDDCHKAQKDAERRASTFAAKTFEHASGNNAQTEKQPKTLAANACEEAETAPEESAVVEGRWFNETRTSSISTSETAASLQNKPKCFCGLYALPLPYSQSGPNLGRIFFRCSRWKWSYRCKFFQWEDEAQKDAEMTSQSPDGLSDNAEITAATPPSQLQPLCYCGLPAMFVTDKGNVGRMSFKCGMGNHRKRCQFFQWVEGSIRSTDQVVTCPARRRLTRKTPLARSAYALQKSPSRSCSETVHADEVPSSAVLAITSSSEEESRPIAGFRAATPSTMAIDVESATCTDRGTLLPPPPPMPATPPAMPKTPMPRRMPEPSVPPLEPDAITPEFSRTPPRKRKRRRVSSFSLDAADADESASAGLSCTLGITLAANTEDESFLSADDLTQQSIFLESLAGSGIAVFQPTVIVDALSASKTTACAQSVANRQVLLPNKSTLCYSKANQKSEFLRLAQEASPRCFKWSSSSRRPPSPRKAAALLSKLDKGSRSRTGAVMGLPVERFCNAKHKKMKLISRDDVDVIRSIRLCSLVRR